MCCSCATCMVWCIGISNLRTFCLLIRRRHHFWRQLILGFLYSLNLVCFITLDHFYFLTLINWLYPLMYISWLVYFCRSNIFWDSWKSILHGSWGAKTALWSRNRCLECWGNPLHPTLWCPTFLGRLVLLPSERKNLVFPIEKNNEKSFFTLVKVLTQTASRRFCIEL